MAQQGDSGLTDHTAVRRASEEPTNSNLSPSADGDHDAPEDQPLLEDESDKEEESEQNSELAESQRQLAEDPRFSPPPPSPLKRLILLAFTLFLFYLAYTLKTSVFGNQKPEVVYASRYSKEHKFRPAASPIITETLKDGRIRIRGAQPTATPEPKPIPKPKKARNKKRVKKTAKRNAGSGR